MPATIDRPARVESLLVRSRHDTRTLARLRREHERLARARGRRWLVLTRDHGVTYDEIVAACGVARNQVTKAIRRAKDEANGSA